MSDAQPTPVPRRTPHLAMALAKAQGLFSAIVKNREVKIHSAKGSYSFRYADLEELLNATRPALTANGLAVVQEITGGVLRTVLMHESGEERVSEIELGGRGDDIKTFGAKISYLRRYAYQSMLCLAADDDLDEDGPPAGEPSSQRSNQKPAKDRADAAYPQADFDKNFPAWSKAIAAGKKTHAEVIAMVESKARLTDDQKDAINAVQVTAQHGE